jgi:FKBP-type peptidyl-prolyl cis-trans isomerase SlyD
MQIGKNSVVAIDYTLTNPKGEVLDSSKGREPLTYIQGSGGIIPGLEAALEGKAAGDAVSVTIPPEQAYGLRDDSMVQKVSRDLFKNAGVIEVGMQFQANNGQEQRVVTIVGFDGDDVKVDANHPLAGTTLHFEVDIKTVRAATQDEIAHGHVHGPGGHHH